MPKKKSKRVPEGTKQRGASKSRTEASASSAPCVIAGVGSSAGGLKALNELIDNLPLDHLALIIVPHLAPEHESNLVEILGRKSARRVTTVTEGTVVEPNRIYVIPPNHDLQIAQGVLHLAKQYRPQGARMVIDAFFRSLAQDQRANAVGVILSGTGSDGTLGLEAIKAAGGVTFAQEPESAAHAGMPQSALASGYADFCLPPKDIASQLIRVSLARRDTERRELSTEAEHEQMQQRSRLFALVRREFGSDLNHYKAATVERRLERRMALHRSADLAAYLTYVEAHAQELHALHQEMLISVTQFFRVPDSYAALADEVLPRLLKHHEPAQAFRVWVPACATGEEAYSIAICILEHLGRTGNINIKLQIFATDIDEEAIAVARSGLYPRSIELDMSPERLKEYFTPEKQMYRVKRSLRDAVIFSKQNLLVDPPFPRMSLVSCRNLLIYLRPPAQQKCLKSLNYALIPNGYLLLGSSESIGEEGAAFCLAHKRHKFYRKSQNSVPSAVRGERPPSFTKEKPLGARPTRLENSLPDLTDRAILQLYGPACVVVDRHLKAQHFRGDMSPYLRPAPGVASLNLLKLARSELHVELHRSIKEAFASHARVTSSVTSVDRDELLVTTLDVVPISPADDEERFVAVFFAQRRESASPASSSANGGSQDETHAVSLQNRVHLLEKELAASFAYIQGLADENATANEEIKANSEEMQAANEELQSTNEELETSKEEMQSSNEELITVNEELQARLSQLNEAYDDRHNVLAGVDNAVFIVGMDLRIRRCTQAGAYLAGLGADVAGRSIEAIAQVVGNIGLPLICQQVIESLTPFAQELEGSNGHWYSMRISPYKTAEHLIRGVVISLIDRSVQKKLDDMEHAVRGYAATHLSDVKLPLLMLDTRKRAVWASAAFYQAFGLTREEIVGAPFSGQGLKHGARSSLHALLENTLHSGAPFEDCEEATTEGAAGARRVRIGGKRVEIGAHTPMLLVSFDLGAL